VRRFAFFFGCFLAWTPLACRHNNDLLENELRERDRQYREALDELGKAEHRSHAQQLEIDALRKGAPITPEQAAQTFGLKNITLGRGTGGVDNDGLPGDEALQVFLEPRDSDGHVIKAPGTLHVLAVEINAQGLKTPFSSWTVPPDKLRASWKQGLLSTGYSLILPWQYCPQTETVRVVARLVTPDGRMYETDKDIKIHLVPGAPRRPDGPPPDFPLPPPTLDPSTVPTGHTAQRPGPAASTSRWQPAALDDAVQLGQPVPVQSGPLDASTRELR
jgi:hypothetical protein